MSKALKISAITIVLASTIAIYWFGFYSQYNQQQVHQNANQVLIVNKKKLVRSFLYHYLKHPSKWQNPFKSASKKAWSWEDSGIKIPDYPTIFTLSNQPANVFYFVSEVQSASDFGKSLQHFYFQKIKTTANQTIYWSDSLNIMLSKTKQGKLLISNQKQIEPLQQIANDLFAKKKHLQAKAFHSIHKQNHHLSYWLKKNQYTNQNSFVHLDLASDSIHANGQLFIAPTYIPNNTVTSTQATIATIALNWQQNWLRTISPKHKEKLQQWLAIKIDSLQPTNGMVFYLNQFQKKEINTITYEYDDDFNEVEVLQKTTEFYPEYTAKLSTTNPQKLYSYLKQNQLISDSATYNQFPFLGSSVKAQDSALLFVNQDNYNQHNNQNKSNSIATIALDLSKIDTSFVANYPYYKDFLWLKKRFSTLDFKAQKQAQAVQIKAVIHPANKQSVFDVMLD